MAYTAGTIGQQTSPSTFDARDWSDFTAGVQYNNGTLTNNASGASISDYNPVVNPDLVAPNGGGGGGGKATNYQNMFNTYYDNIYNQLQGSGKYDAIGYTPIDYQMRTQQELAAEIADYLRPQYDQAIANQRKSERSNRAAVDIDAASRGMGSSTWVTDSKNRISNESQYNIGNLESNYGATLAQNVASQYAQQVQNKLGVDQFNTSNQLQVDEFNAKLKQALDELAYARAGDQVDLWKASQKRSGGGGGINAQNVLAIVEQLQASKDPQKQLNALVNSGLVSKADANASATYLNNLK